MKITIDVRLILVGIAVLFVAGCATIGQAKLDYDLGKSTPLAAGEQAPADIAAPYVAVASSIPFTAPVAPLFGTLLTGFLAWQRGRSIRKGLPASANPITGYFGEKAGIESAIQNLANLVTGIFHADNKDSALGHAWQVLISTVLAGVAAAIAFPPVHTFIVSNPSIAAGVAGFAALFAGIQKQLATVLPVAQPAPGSTTTV